MAGEWELELAEMRAEADRMIDSLIEDFKRDREEGRRFKAEYEREQRILAAGPGPFDEDEWRDERDERSQREERHALSEPSNPYMEAS